MVGLGASGKRKVRTYSLGMRQRLGLAAALLGDPRVLVLDEPANGLDPEGIRWLRGFFRHLAAEGRSVLVSSHQLNEVQEIADRVVILNRGQLVRSGSIQELLAGTDSVIARGPDLGPLDAALRRHGYAPQQTGPASMQVAGVDTETVGHLAFTAGVELHELSKHGFDLEDLFFQLTRRRPAGRSPMIRLVRAEFLKLRTTQVWFWMLIAAVAVTVLLVVAQLAPSDNVRSYGDAVDSSTVSGSAYVVVFVLGVLGVTTEFRYQTITPTVLVTPSRWALITAKMITYAIVGAIYAFICVVAELAVALPWLRRRVSTCR